MLSYCLKCRWITESKIPKVVNKEDWTVMLLSNYAVWTVKNENLWKRKS